MRTVGFVWRFLSGSCFEQNTFLQALGDKNILSSRLVTKNSNAIQSRSQASKSALDYSKVPKLNEDDLEERFVRGSGPGGQSVAKTCNAVVLKHKPTGIVVKCHETRSLWDNKQRARENLITRLDNMMNGKDSIENQKKAVLAKKSASMTRKREKMLALKKAFKEREGID